MSLNTDDREPDAAMALLVGGYTADGGGSAAGIGLLELTAAGMRSGGTLVTTESPSFLVAHRGRVLAAAEHAARLDAFAWDGGALRRTGSAPTSGSEPCHLSALGDRVIVSCYGDGVVESHPLDAAGRPGPATQALAPDPGCGAPNRGGPHAHATLALSDGRLLSTDLGTDAVHVHVTGADGVLRRTSTTRVGAGSGPRHLARHPSGAILVVTELSCELLVLDHTAALVDRLPLTDGTPGSPSEIVVSRDGRTVYAAVRDSDVLVALHVPAGGGSPVPLQVVSSGGRHPRHIALVDDHLYAANERSGSVADFRVADDGTLAQVGEVAVPSPTYLLPVPAPER